LDDRITDDKFCVAFDVTGASSAEVDKYKSFLNNSGVDEIGQKII
jgi:hypothetical protein